MAITTDTTTGSCAAHAPFGLAEFVASILAQSRLSKSVFVYALLYTHRFASAQSARVEDATGVQLGGGKLHHDHISSGKDECGGDYSRVKVDVLPTCAHCLFLGTLMIAFKFTNDNCYKIKYWAEWAQLSRAEIVQLEIKILTALNYECAGSQQSFDQWAQVYSSHSARPGSTSLYSAIILYVQAIRRLQSATLALTVHSASQQLARHQQHRACVRDISSGMVSPSNDSGIFSSTDASPIGPTVLDRRCSVARTPSPGALGIVTPPGALPTGRSFAGFGTGNVNYADAAEAAYHYNGRGHSDAYYHHYSQAPTPPVHDDASTAPSTVQSRPCSVPPACHYSGRHSNTAIAYPTPASRIGSVPTGGCSRTYGATSSGTMGSLSIDSLAGMYSGNYQANVYLYGAATPTGARSATPSCGMEAAMGGRRVSASSTAYIYPPTSLSSVRHAPYPAHYRALRPRPSHVVATPAPVQALYGAWC